MSVIVRFAPSPTGLIHVGNVRTALMNWLYAHAHGGQFMLRLDDTDVARSTQAFADGIKKDLAWLGLAHDLSARQSDRFDDYERAVQSLKSSGRLYPCYETGEELDLKRKLQRTRGLPPVYDRAALELSDAERASLEAEGGAPHWRFKLSGNPVRWTDLIRGEVTIETSNVSDPILIRQDGSFLYTLPSVVDDIDFSISHIIRGEDHVTNSAAQIEIFESLGAAPPSFGHHPLLTGAGGEALSKRLGSLSIESMREEGIEPMALNSFLAKLGTSDPIEPRQKLEDLINEFNLAKLNRAPAKFDPQDLKSLNAKLLHEVSFDEVADKLKELGVDGGAAFWDAARTNIEQIADVKEWWTIVSGEINPVIEDAAWAAKAAELLPQGDFDDQTWGAWTTAIKESTGAKGRHLFMPLRLALTGRSHGPEMAKMLPLIGREKAHARLMGSTI